MSQKNLFKKTALAAAVAIISSNVYAAGFQLNEYSSSGLGRSFSGEGAVADNATSASRNPATMMMFDRPTFSAGAIFVDPGVDISGTSRSGNSLNAKNIAPAQWIPNLHYIHPLNDQWAVGGSVTSNYGLATEFNDGYTAGPYGGKTDLTTVNLNLSAAYRLNQHFSFGLGFDALYAKAKLERYAGESGAAVGMPADTQISHLKGDEWGYGWNAGILYEVDENNRYGLTYRSEIKVDFDGDYKSSIPSAYNPMQGMTGLPWGTDGNTIPGSLSLHLPEMWEISGYNKVAPKWAVHYSLAYTSWSQFQELRATGSNGQTLFEKHEGFKDAYRIALGTTYYYDDNWTFRTGIAFDDSPVPAQNRSISIPDQDRFWLSAGTTYAFNQNASVDVGVSYMHGQHVTIKEGPYTFESDGKAWLYGANFNYTF
ncbi:long-chain fatty acid transporter FadL [Serratia rubidaea]|uniref:Long-chain fatty acid transport protein n=1 Tax=Serratia rubidaea TaxID=61652 RepID=A0A3S5F1Z7_SERRU|nr:long-chain fatty acid transporter FadL [Serratia rubidaea]MBH1929392.1 long-chain fatty acid transporter FadL [Serratia rubidaea]MDC6118136.1 long-chain fatty acid transporter FadL [Serratia rubidaea]MEB7585473.1 long-chain fatty acid transporter FadL [Serratia rubidaea]VEI67438.1 Outer membrane flp protein [Serratia rubidaea]